MRLFLLFSFFFLQFNFLFSFHLFAESSDSADCFVKQPDSLIFIIEDSSCSLIIISDSIPQKTQSATHENKRVIAAILAFPLPFGILGVHRIYLGTKPYMPFAYIGTLGGCFGILPLIDFCTILFSDDETFKEFENNPRVIMWSH